MKSTSNKKSIGYITLVNEVPQILLVFDLEQNIEGTTVARQLFGEVLQSVEEEAAESVDSDDGTPGPFPLGSGGGGATSKEKDLDALSIE